MLTIGEVAEKLNIKAHILRYWEDQFPMLQPLKRAGGRRYYRPDDVALLERIDRLLNAEGYTIKGAVAALKAQRNPAPLAAGLRPEAANTNHGPATSSAGAAEMPLPGAMEGLPPNVRQKLQSTRDNLSRVLKED